VPRPELPPVVWAVPWAALLVLPLVGDGPLGARLSILFAELMLGLPALAATPPELRAQVLPMRRLGRRGLLLALCAAPLVAAVHQGLTLAQAWLWPMPETLAESIRRTYLPAGGPADALALSSLLLVAPVTEEIFFRGVMPWLWRRRFRRGVLAGTAIVFAAAHLNPWAFFPLVVLGLALGWLREASGSLAPCVLAHAAVNLTSYLWLRAAAPP